MIETVEKYPKCQAMVHVRKDDFIGFFCNSFITNGDFAQDSLCRTLAEINAPIIAERDKLQQQVESLRGRLEQRNVDCDELRASLEESDAVRKRYHGNLKKLQDENSRLFKALAEMGEQKGFTFGRWFKFVTKHL